MNHHYIAFGTFRTDWPMINELYREAAGTRITLSLLKGGNAADLPTTKKLWVDAQVDGLHFPEVFSASDTGFRNYRTYIDAFPNARRVASNPDKASVSEFVRAVLDSVIETAKDLPTLGYISVPQLPYIRGTSRNKVNRMLADATLKWRTDQRRPPRMILPVIFAKTRGQTDTKTDRNPSVKLAASCFEASGADGVWIVDSTLDDHAAANALENERLPGVIHFHEELNEKLPSETVTIAGPYWGLNLALWARGLVRFPAVGIGRAYQYFVPGRAPQSTAANTRVAVAPLKRLAVTAALKPWLHKAARQLPKNDPASGDFERLARSLESLQVKEHARRQIAQFYRDWLMKLELVPASARALTLYQDFSAAFVLGSRLEPFDRNAEDVPNPAIIAKQLMVNCL